MSCGRGGREGVGESIFYDETNAFILQALNWDWLGYESVVMSRPHYASWDSCSSSLIEHEIWEWVCLEAALFSGSVGVEYLPGGLQYPLVTSTCSKPITVIVNYALSLDRLGGL